MPRRRKVEKPPAKPQLDGAAPRGDRVAKVMARAGVCSRRDAEAMIAAGRVALNGKLLTTPAVTIGPGDVVTVDGKPLPAPEPTRLWRYHKPTGVLTADRDPEGRPTLRDSLPAGLPRVMTVGRLDLNSEGLLLLTNDGALARHLELPSTGWLRRYRARVHGAVDQTLLDRVKDGVTIDGVRYGPLQATLERTVGTNSWITVALREGKNREVRTVLDSLGLSVSRLIRISYGPFQLGDLAPGAVEEVKGKVLREQVPAAVVTRSPAGRERHADHRRPA